MKTKLIFREKKRKFFEKHVNKKGRILHKFRLTFGGKAVILWIV